ncbi:hypothetical protein M9H77_18519 [Catharanthus roseus]|uniref:Uncharacterized protein n=1 Tax=Catharanthus roseus TaxID=4058 RepID=A0ACC0B7Q6_CATRO|nr:hypothetical protein M9H77_18519 [Catharanthus roseus]
MRCFNFLGTRLFTSRATQCLCPFKKEGVATSSRYTTGVEYTIYKLIVTFPPPRHFGCQMGILLLTPSEEYNRSLLSASLASELSTETFVTLTISEGDPPVSAPISSMDTSAQAAQQCPKRIFTFTHGAEYDVEEGIMVGADLKHKNQ